MTGPDSAVRRPDPLRVPQTAAIMVVALAGLALCGWAFSIDALKSILPGAVAMNPLTAGAFVLAGSALWFLGKPFVSHRHRLWIRTAGGTLLAIGIVVLSRYAFGWDLRIDRWLFSDALHNNQMAPNTAVHFVLVGLALLLFDRSTRSGLWVGQIPALATACGALLAIVGYCFQAAPLYEIRSFIPMALNTSVAFGILSVGILCARPAHGLMALLNSEGAGGFVARRLLPMAVGAPLLLGWLRLQGELRGLYQTEFGVALMVVATTILYLAAGWWIGRALDRSDEERRAAERQLQALHAELEQRVRDRTAELAAANAALTAEIAERTRAVAAERESEQRFRLLVDGVQDYAILMLDTAGRIVSWNSGAERIIGYRADEIVGEHFSRFYPQADRQAGRPERELEIAAAAGRYEEEGLRVRRDGTQFLANVIVTAIYDDSGQLCGFSKVTRDVTERKQTEEREQRLNANLAEQVAKLAQTNRELSQKTEENETFVYSVSHDLRSPLVNLQGFSRELSSVCEDLRAILTENELPTSVRKRGLTLLDDEMGESIRFIQTAVLRLSNIIDALLRLSRAGRIEYRPQSADLNSIVRRIVDSMSGTIAERGVTVTIKELPHACGDTTALELVFANLIGNAVKYLDPQRPGVVEVGCEPGGGTEDGHAGFHCCYVRDNGLGMPQSAHARAFQAFQRLHPEHAEGEGMGLAIVRRIVERHGGQIRVESAVGVGSTFFVSLPAAPAEVAALRQNPIPEDSYERIPANGRGTIDHCVGGRR